MISSTYSGVYFANSLLSASKLSVLRVTNSSSNKPSLTITLAMPFISAVSVPILGLNQVWANGKRLVCWGSMSNSLAPLPLTARLTAYPAIGADEARLAPMTIITSDCSRASRRLVVPGKPTADPSPTMLAALYRRLPLSILLVPSTLLVNLCNR